MPQGRGEQIKAKEGMKSDDSFPLFEGGEIDRRMYAYRRRVTDKV